MSDTLTHSQYALCRSLFSAQNRSNNYFLGSKAFVHYIIDLNVDYSILSRGAGRPQVASDYTLEEVEKMLQKGMSSEEIANLLHMSLSSFYRRLKKARTEKSIIHSDVIVF